MTVDVQQLLLKIDASTELARRELKKMDGDFDAFTRRSEETAAKAEGTFKSFGVAATAAKASIIGFAAGIGIEGVIAFGRAVLSAADDLDAAAERAGIGAERYQTLKESLRALKVDGEKVDSIFGRLTDTLGAVQGGTAAAGVEAALDKMGIKSRILNGEITTTDGLLDAIAESAGKFNTQAEFTAAVVDLVGKKLGIDLANALKDGGVALKQGEKAFRDAGGVVSEEYIARLADANEAIDQFVSRSKSQLLIWAGASITALDRVIDKYGALRTAALAAALINPVTAIPAAQALIRGANGVSDRELEGLNDKFPLFRPAPAAPRVPPPKAALANRGSGGGGSRRTVSAAKAELTPAQIRAQEGYLPPEEFTGLSNAQGKIKEIVPQIDEIRRQFDAIRVAAVDVSNVEIIDPAIAQVASGIADDLTAGLSQAVVYGRNLGDVFKGIAAQVLSSGLLNLLSGGAQGTSFAASLGGLGQLFGGFFANGGNPPMGKISMVGERGPELFIPRVPGTIVPNHMLGGGGGGVSISQTFAPNFAGNAATREDLVLMGQMAKTQAIAGVFEAISRRGSKR